MFKFLLRQVSYFRLEGKLDLWENSTSNFFLELNGRILTGVISEDM